MWRAGCACKDTLFNGINTPRRGAVTCHTSCWGSLRLPDPPDSQLWVPGAVPAPEHRSVAAPRLPPRCARHPALAEAASGFSHGGVGDYGELGQV